MYDIHSFLFDDFHEEEYKYAHEEKTWTEKFRRVADHPPADFPGSRTLGEAAAGDRP
jgi:hypothetical protein